MSSLRTSFLIVMTSANVVATQFYDKENDEAKKDITDIRVAVLFFYEYGLVNSSK